MVPQGQHYLTSAQQRGKASNAAGCTACFLLVIFCLSIHILSPLWKCHQSVSQHGQRYTTNVVFHITLGLCSTYNMQFWINIDFVIFFNISSISSGYLVTVYSQIWKLSYSNRKMEFYFSFDTFSMVVCMSFSSSNSLLIRDEKNKTTLNSFYICSFLSGTKLCQKQDKYLPRQTNKNIKVQDSGITEERY